jgi:hypothetical protein
VTNSAKAAWLSVIINGFALAMMFTMQPWALRASDIFFRLGYWILERIFGGAAELGILAIAFALIVNIVAICAVLWAGLAIWERARAAQT